ncbi:MAG TPA: 4'-phosphopantetheinyl transferase superfamily protein [Kofleriaceae bacterium]
MRRSDLVDTPHGRALIVELDDEAGAEAALLGNEATIAAALGPVRRREFIAGRAALRSLLGEPVPIVPDDRGAPILPAGWVGSISHKGERAAALLAPAGDGFVGLDIEVAASPRQPIEKRILTLREQQHVRDGRDVTRSFAIKEAIYKAIDPMVRRYVGFTEVELDVATDGSCAVHILDASRLPVVVEAWWQERDGLWLATARARPR